ncbi:unnamed protein product [Strongylus vulgaris]|uniref:Glycerol-3-phosphate dehydrogenase NAD-dependent C-terminal domain-containing protein n=1 Tax=Strongylus vulgaris TaxID=40348 RepID=A0A3P7LJ04_STRVU|nr:unnamed protein product [Strongylus vulgaris]
MWCSEGIHALNVVACATGFSDGLAYGDNTKSAIIRLGLMEITKVCSISRSWHAVLQIFQFLPLQSLFFSQFVDHCYPGSSLATFFESCGIADLVTTCNGGRNRKVCEAFVKTGKLLEEVEKELLHGQSAQGSLTAEEVYFMTEKSGLAERLAISDPPLSRTDIYYLSNSTYSFPLFTAVHQICKGVLKPEEMIKCLRSHPEHIDPSIM